MEIIIDTVKAHTGLIKWIEIEVDFTGDRKQQFFGG